MLSICLWASSPGLAEGRDVCLEPVTDESVDPHAKRGETVHRCIVRD